MQLAVISALWAIEVFRIVLFVRIVLDLVRGISRNFRPKGLFLVLAELVYTLTDWVIKPLGKLIKPIRIGPGYMDLSILVLFLALILLETLLTSLL
jgi:YggT family protein